VPSYAAQTNFRTVRQRFPAYSYKEAALNPTNPADRATDWEADIIRVFRDDRGRGEVQLQRETPTGRTLVLARPIRVKSPACLSCHDRAENAPASVVQAYGPNNGFGWKFDEIVGAQVVSVPIGVSLDRAWAAFINLVVVLGGVFVVIAVLLNLLLQVLVISPVLRIAHMAGEVSMGRLDTPELRGGGHDEIGSLAASFNRMRRSLESALKMINESD
jgi:HAMP domain-containing protein